MKTIFLLYLQFLKIGTLAFGGGYAVIPLIQEFVVEQKGWISMTEFTDLVSISQMTPGPIAMNAATFVGAKVGGLPGSIAATAGAVTPQLFLMMLLGYFLFSKKKKFKILDWLLTGIRPGIVGLIFIAALSMMKNSIFPNGVAVDQVQPVAAICFLVGLFAYSKKVDLIQLIGVGAVLGIVFSLVL